jgi:hypothetical protein
MKRAKIVLVLCFHGPLGEGEFEEGIGCGKLKFPERSAGSLWIVGCRAFVCGMMGHIPALQKGYIIDFQSFHPGWMSARVLSGEVDCAALPINLLQTSTTMVYRMCLLQ